MPYPLEDEGQEPVYLTKEMPAAVGQVILEPRCDHIVGTIPHDRGGGQILWYASYEREGLEDRFAYCPLCGTKLP